MKPSGFHDGDRSEYLAAFAFDTIGYSVPVPRQEDRFLVDLLVHLALRDDQERLVPQGIVFCVQVKSDKSPIGVRAEHVEWLNKFMAPLYISVVDKAKQTLEIFHTMRRIEAAHHPSGNALALCMQDELPTTISIGNKNFDCDPIPLGKPIARIELPALDAEDTSIKKARRHEFFQLMLGWSVLEQTALTWRHAKLPFLPVVEYETNRLPNFNDFEYATYGSLSDIGPGTLSLGVLLVAYRSFLENVEQHAEGETGEPIQAAKDAAHHLFKTLQDLLPKLVTAQKQ